MPAEAAARVQAAREKAEADYQAELRQRRAELAKEEAAHDVRRMQGMERQEVAARVCSPALAD